MTEGSITEDSEGVEVLKGDYLVLKELFEFFICKPCILDDCFKGVRIKSFMVWDSYSMSSIGHADMFTSGYNFETYLTECSDRMFGRDISKKHFRQEPLPDIQKSPLFLQLSSGDKL